MRTLGITLLALLCLLVPVTTARASGQTVINDCEEHGELTGTYTKQEYQSALDSMPTDLKEYSNCETLIDQALARLRNAKHHHGDTSGGALAPGGSGGAGGAGAPPGTGSSLSAQAPGREPKRVVAPSAFAPPTAIELQAVDRARYGLEHTADGPLPTTPGATSRLTNGVDGVPLPLRALVVLLALAGLAALVTNGRRRLRRGDASAA